MKVKQIIVTILAVLSSIGFFSCGEESINPEVSVAEGTVDFFSEAMDFPSSGGTRILNFTTNVKWTLAISETQTSASWCTISQSEGSAGSYNISVTVGENAGYEDRNVVLVLTAGKLKKNIIVNQKQKQAITTTKNRFEVGNEGGTIEVEINSNVDYIVEIPEGYRSWISQKAETRALSSKILSFNIAESKEYDKREGEIMISSGDIVETVKIYQSGSAILILSQNEFFLNNEGGTIYIDVNSNFEFEVDMPDVNWIKTSDITRAVSSHTLMYDISPNTSHDNREAVIVLKDVNSDKKESVSIKQKQKDAIILANDWVQISQDGGVFSVEVNSNVDYSIEIPSSCSSWLSRTSSPSSANTTRALSHTTQYFKALSSEEYDKREGEIIFKYNDITETFKVYQSGGAVIILSQDTYHIEGGVTTINVQLKSNIDYTVSIANDWISEVSTRAVSSSTKSFIVSTNKTGKNRTGKIYFTSVDGTRSAIVTINQAALVEVSSLDISFYGTLYAYVGETYNFFVTCTPNNAATDYEWSSSNTNVLSVSGTGSTAKVKIVGYGEANVIVKENNSEKTKEYSIHSRVSGFSWNSTGETYSGYYPMITLAIGDSEKLSYSSDQGSSITNLFSNLSDFVFYEPTNIVSQPSVISIDADGTVTGLKTGTIGIKPTGYITRSNNGNDRIYIKVVKEYEETEYNNDFSHANTIKPNQKMRFKLSSSGDVDVFSFTRPSQYFYVKVTYEGDLGTSSGTRILSYNLYNSSYSEFGSGNLSFNASGGEYSQYRWINTTQGYIRFCVREENMANFTPNGYFTVEFVTEN